MKVIGLAGSVRNAMRQVEAGVDAVVAQGYEAGGHTGRIATLPLVPQVVDAVAPTPVLAAGGIGDGRGLAAALSLGAVGAWVGTAFLTSVESERLGCPERRDPGCTVGGLSGHPGVHGGRRPATTRTSLSMPGSRPA